VQKAALEALKSNSCTWATHRTLCRTWSLLSSSGQLPLQSRSRHLSSFLWSHVWHLPTHGSRKCIP
jgi:hypothetical protein